MKSHLYIILSAVFFASSILFTDKVSGFIPAFTLNTLRFLIGGSFLFLLGKGIPFRCLKTRDILQSLLRGCLGITFYYVLETFALGFISAKMVSILVGLSFVLNVGYEALKKEIVVIKELLASIGLIFMGMIIVSWQDLMHTAPQDFLAGVGCMLVANVSWVGYIRLEKTKPKSLTIIQAVGLDMLLGALCILPGALFEPYLYWIKSGFPQAEGLIYLAVLPSAAAYFFYSKAAQKLPGSICSLYLNLIPILSILTITLSLENTLALYEWLGVAVVGICIVYTNYSYEKQKKLNLTFTKHEG